MAGRKLTKSLQPRHGTGDCEARGLTDLQRGVTNLPDGGRGILWMLLTMLIFACINAIAKYLALSYPVPQVVWARYAFHLLLLALLLRGRLPRAAATKRLGLQLLRSSIMVITTGLYFTGIHFIPLADPGAIDFDTVIFNTEAHPLLSVP